MSWQAMDAIDRIPYEACKPLEFRVLTKLANVAAQDGSRAYRSIAEMATELKVSQRSIQRALKALEDERFILRGEQRHLAHLRADRRPTVYNINMPKCLDWDAYHGHLTPELDGVTQLSTPPVETAHGVTNGVTTAVAQGTNRTNYLSTQGNHTAHVTPSAGPCGHELVDDRHCILGCAPAELVTT